MLQPLLHTHKRSYVHKHWFSFLSTAREAREEIYYLAKGYLVPDKFSGSEDDSESFTL